MATTKKKYNLYSASKSTEKKNFNPLLLPILFTVMILPFIVHAKSFTGFQHSFFWLPDNHAYTDIFNYYKMIYFSITCIICAGILVYKKFIKHEKLKADKIFYFLCVYAVLTLLSTIFSKYSEFALGGILEYYETLTAILSYCIICYYAYQVINSLDDVYTIIKWWTVTLFIFALLGASQLTDNYSFFKSELGRKLLLPRSAWGNLDSLQFFFEGTVYLTLYNPNYVGFYGAMCFPFFVSKLWFNRDKIKSVLLNVSLVAISILFIAGSGSSAGLLTSIVTLGLFVLFIRKELMKNIKLIVIAIVSICTFLVVGDFVTNHRFTTIVTSLYNNITNQTNEDEINLSYFLTNDDNITLVYKKNTLVVSYDMNEGNDVVYHFSDGEGNNLSSTFDVATGTLTDERFKDIIFVKQDYNGIPIVTISIDAVNWHTSKDVEGFKGYVLLNDYLKFTKAIRAESAIFTGHELMGSGRGYIWAKTIPLLKDRIILGSGPCSYIMSFPQNDYVDKIMFGFGKNLLVDKPHNMYLQAGISSGVIAMLSLIGFYLVYLYQSFMLYWKHSFDTPLSQIALSFLLTNIAFMVAGLFNDSNLNVSTAAWCFIGIGIALNTMVKNQLKENTADIQHK